VAYWHKGGLEIYRLEGGKPVKEASGNLEELKPLRSSFTRKILIVGRDLLFHTRKRYPPTPVEKLTKAVALEIGAIFPLSKPAFHCRVHESSAAHTTLDIWAWESEPYARLREIFPFHFAVPEDLACLSASPEIKIFQSGGMIHLLASAQNRFLAGASYPETGLEDGAAERFFSGLGRYTADIKEVRVFGALNIVLKNGEREIVRSPRVDYPPCLQNIFTLDLKPFKAKGEFRSPVQASLLLRVLIYILIGYGLMLYLTDKNYDQAAGELRQKIRKTQGGTLNQVPASAVTDYSEVIAEVNEKLAKKVSPLTLMERLARRLPEGSFITRIALNENILDVSAASKEPLSVVKALGGMEGIKTARLKGPPVKDGQTGSFNFVVTLELLG
jgi:hypothetical protein